MASVFLNGRFLDRDDAAVSAFDAGFQHGVGLFETMLARRAPGSADAAAVAIVGLHEHLQRLAASARALGLSEHLRTGALAEACERTVVKASQSMPGIRDFRVRLTVTGGDLNLLGRHQGIEASGHPGMTPEGKLEDGVGAGDRQDPTVLIVAQPATAYPAEMFERGVAVVIADFKANPLDPFAGHKTLNYWPRLRELQIAGAKRAAEALVFQVTNHLAGGCVSNAFVVKDKELFTPIARGEENADGSIAADEPDAPARGSPSSSKPALPSPVLPGITRGLVIDLAAREGLSTTSRMLTIHDVLNADELFLTNSSWGVLPVVKVEREAIGDGVVGPVSKSLREAWTAHPNR